MSAHDVESVVHRISVVIPVYRGERTLPGLLAEIAPLAQPSRTASGAQFVVTECLLVYDNGPDHSDRTIRELADTYDFVRPIWLSRNFGQHPATLAGMASSNGDWIVTLDEDGQHDPADLAKLLDVAIAERASLVYADPVNLPSHGVWRNAASRLAKLVFGLVLSGGAMRTFQSFRLIKGELARSVAAYAGPGVYLDVAIQWVSPPASTCPVRLRDEGGDRVSGYSLRSLLSHFWRLVLSSGTRGLRLVSALGFLFALFGGLAAIYVAFSAVRNSEIPQGWTSLAVILLVTTGCILFALGVIAEYIGVAVNMAMGKPIYVIVSDPETSRSGER